jgi:hypothetical protein
MAVNLNFVRTFIVLAVSYFVVHSFPPWFFCLHIMYNLHLPRGINIMASLWRDTIVLIGSIWYCGYLCALHSWLSCDDVAGKKLEHPLENIVNPVSACSTCGGVACEVSNKRCCSSQKERERDAPVALAPPPRRSMMHRAPRAGDALFLFVLNSSSASHPSWRRHILT